MEHSSYRADPGPWENEYEPQSDTLYPAVSTYLPYLYGLDEGVCIGVLDMLRISVQDMTADSVPLVGMLVTNIPYDRQSYTIYLAASTCVSHTVQDVTVDCVPVPVQDITVDCVPYVGTVLGNVPLVCGSLLYTQSEDISDRLIRISDRLIRTVDCVLYVCTVLGNVPPVCGSVLYTQSKNVSDRLTRISDGPTRISDELTNKGREESLSFTESLARVEYFSESKGTEYFRWARYWYEYLRPPLRLVTCEM